MHVLVRLLISDIVGHNDAVSSLVVRGSDGLEALLASGVPNLKFDLLSINLYSFNFEVYSDSGHEVISELVVSESHQQRGFTNTRRANQKYFKQVVAKTQVRYGW